MTTDTAALRSTRYPPACSAATSARSSPVRNGGNPPTAAYARAVNPRLAPCTCGCQSCQLPYRRVNSRITWSP